MIVSSPLVENLGLAQRRGGDGILAGFAVTALVLTIHAIGRCGREGEVFSSPLSACRSRSSPLVSHNVVVISTQGGVL